MAMPWAPELTVMSLGKRHSRDVQQQGIPLATSAAEGSDPVASAQPTQLVRQGQDEPGAAHTDGMPETQ
jgi:hypothetical protein